MTDKGSERSKPEEGVLFRVVDGARSSTATGKRVFADAVRGVDASVASRIENAKDWRKSYMPHVRAVVAAGIGQNKDPLRIAADGLESLHRHLSFTRRGDEMTLRDAFGDGSDASSFATTTVSGQGAHPRVFEVPYRGRRLSGGQLLGQLDDWVERGVLEPSCRDALTLVIENPEWLQLADQRIALLGAASEMGPLEPLSAWGANIVALDLPRPQLWNHIFGVVRAGSGTVSAPLPETEVDASDPSAVAGADLLIQLPEIRAWLGGFEGPMTLGNYVYADGATFVRLAGATDALISSLIAERSEVALAYLATPTDVFAVRTEVVDAAHARRSAKGSVVGSLTRSKLYAPNYRETWAGEDGGRWGLSDSLVPIQGPNYALAKSLQRWRATLAREEGCLSSANVAPASHTRSVVKNKLLAAVYRGAPAFGVEIFQSETTRWLMAGLLVHDLRNPRAVASPDTKLDHPYDLFADAALHGGIWRLGYEPRSILPLGLAVGLVKRT